MTSLSRAENVNKSLKPKLKNRDSISGYAYISPFFILFAIFGLFPILYTIYISFHSWDILGDAEFIGLLNYEMLFLDPTFWQSLYNTTIIWVLSTFPQLVLALVLAFVLNQAFLKGRKFFQTGIFLPYVTSTVSVAIIFSAIFGQHYGIVNYLLALFNFDPINWPGSVFGTHFAIAVMVMWRWTGYNMIIYLAALQSIPKDLYEAATIDGANKLQQLIYVTIPMIRPMIVFTVILSTIGGFQIFAEPLLFSGAGGGGANQGLTATLYLYEEAFTRYSFGYSAAIAWILFLIIAMFSAINYLLTRFIKSAD